MQNGIYQVRFITDDNDYQGIMVVDKNTYNGGGHGYFYQGRLAVADNMITGNIHLKKWDEKTPPVLGFFKEINIFITGQYKQEGKSFDFRGRATGHHVVDIKAEAVFIAPMLSADYTDGRRC